MIDDLIDQAELARSALRIRIALAMIRAEAKATIVDLARTGDLLPEEAEGLIARLGLREA